MQGTGSAGRGPDTMDKMPVRGMNLRTFASLKSGTYRIYWAAMMAQMGAMNMQMVARSLLMYEITKSATMLGAVGLANAFPMLILALFGGVMADRVQKKYVLVAGQAASAALALFVAICISFGIISGSFLLLAAVLQGIVMALMMPSRQAIVPEIVGREDLMNALSLNAAGMNINRLMAPVFAGFLVEWSGGVGASAYATVYYAMAALYLIGTVIILFIPKTGTISLKGNGALRDVLSGLQYVRDNRTVLMVLLITLIGVILSMPYMFLLPVFTTDIWNVGPGGFGILMSVSGIGAIAGSLVLASLGNERRGVLYLGSMLLTGVGLTLLAFSPSFHIALGVIIIVGVGQAGRMALSNTLVQYYTEEAYRGRVMSIYMMEFGVTSASTFLIALLSEVIGVQWAVGGAAIALVVIVLVSWIGLPSLRRLD